MNLPDEIYQETIYGLYDEIEKQKDKITTLQNALIDIINDYQDKTSQYYAYGHITQTSINKAKQALGIELTNRSFIHIEDIK